MAGTPVRLFFREADLATYRPADGALAIAQDTATLWMRILGVWVAATGIGGGGGGAPAAHHLTHEAGGTDALVVDADAATGSLRTLGAGAQQAASGADVAAALAAKEATANKGAADGYASLDSGGKVPNGQLPALTATPDARVAIVQVGDLNLATGGPYNGLALEVYEIPSGNVLEVGSGQVMEVLR